MTAMRLQHKATAFEIIRKVSRTLRASGTLPLAPVDAPVITSALRFMLIASPLSLTQTASNTTTFAGCVNSTRTLHRRRSFTPTRRSLSRPLLLTKHVMPPRPEQPLQLEWVSRDIWKLKLRRNGKPPSFVPTEPQFFWFFNDADLASADLAIRAGEPHDPDATVFHVGETHLIRHADQQPIASPAFVRRGPLWRR